MVPAPIGRKRDRSSTGLHHLHDVLAANRRGPAVVLEERPYRSLVHRRSWRHAWNLGMGCDSEASLVVAAQPSGSSPAAPTHRRLVRPG